MTLTLEPNDIRDVVEADRAQIRHDVLMMLIEALPTDRR